MLLIRIFTAIILATITITAIFTLPTLGFYLFIAIIILLAAWEWLRLIGVDNIIGKLIFLVCLLVLMLGVTFFTQLLEALSALFNNLAIKKQSGILEWLVILPVMFWIFMMLTIKRIPEVLLNLELAKYYKVLIGGFVLFFAWMFLVKLKVYYGAESALYFLLLICFADISAYFCGKKFGKDKLAPSISPSKTIQGMYGALFSGLICGISLALYYEFPLMIASDFVLLSLLTVLISIYGDLFFSLVKRQADVKDSGFLLPGHGGILDRIDGMVASVPFYYAGIIVIGWVENVYS